MQYVLLLWMFSLLKPNISCSMFGSGRCKAGKYHWRLSRTIVISSGDSRASLTGRSRGSRFLSGKSGIAIKPVFKLLMQKLSALRIVTTISLSSHASESYRVTIFVLPQHLFKELIVRNPCPLFINVLALSCGSCDLCCTVLLCGHLINAEAHCQRTGAKERSDTVRSTQVLLHRLAPRVELFSTREAGLLQTA